MLPTWIRRVMNDWAYLNMGLGAGLSARDDLWQFALATFLFGASALCLSFWLWMKRKDRDQTA